MRLLLAALVTFTIVGPLSGIGFAARPYVAIDPGHGDKDTGAVGILEPGTVTGLPERLDGKGRAVLYEKDVNLDIARRLDAHMRAWGARTILTRTQDLAGGDRPFTTTTADLKARTDLANEVGADIFVSIHNNAMSSPAGTGTETFHYYYSSPAVAASGLGRSRRSWWRISALTDRGVKDAGFYVLRPHRDARRVVEGAFSPTRTTWRARRSACVRHRGGGGQGGSNASPPRGSHRDRGAGAHHRPVVD